jgi:hypothetical protein
MESEVSTSTTKEPVMPHHHRGVYDAFDSVSEMFTHYKRCRTLKDFIPSERFIAKHDPICDCCGKKCADHGTEPEGYRSWRGVYNPRAKTFRVMHYVCAWTGLIAAISSMRSEA